jgi:hypothetical protein
LDDYISGLFLERLRVEPVVIRGTPAADDLVEAVRRLEDAEAELEAYLSASVKFVGVELFEAKARERVDAVSAARARVAELQRPQPSVALTVAVLDEWPNLTVEERRSLLSAAIHAVLVSPAAGRGSRRSVGKRVDVFWAGDELPALAGLAA